MNDALVSTLACVTIGAPRPEDLRAMIANEFGWEISSEGPITPEMETLWGINPGSAGNWFTVLRSPGINRGMIRVIQGVDRYPVRPMGTRWTGVEIVVMREIDVLYKALERHPHFRITKNPKLAEYTEDSDSAHQYFFGRGPGGTHFMFTMFVAESQRIELPTAPARVGQVFSAPLVSRDYAKSQRFYRGTLHMAPMVEYHLTSGPMHEAWNLPEGTLVDLEILKGAASGVGLSGVELQAYDAAFIDTAPLARYRFDGGACLVTLRTRDIDAAYQAISRSSDATVIGPPVRIAAAPYDGARVFCFFGPSGERLEIAESFAGEDAPSPLTR